MNPIAQQVDNDFWFIIGSSLFFLLLVMVAMIYFVIRYRASKHPKSEDITGSTTLEVLWTVIPLALVMVMFFYGWDVFKSMRTIPSDAMNIKVTGRMWYWSFEYANKKKSDTLLYVPQGKPIKMNIESADVSHSFYLPQFRIKEDAIPGRTNYLVFYPDQLGTFDIYCAEYCGLNHSYMLGHLIVMPPDKFYEWYNKADTVTQSVVPVTDTTKSAPVKTDSLKTVTTQPVTKDSTKTKDLKIDKNKAPPADTLKRKGKK